MNYIIRLCNQDKIEFGTYDFFFFHRASASIRHVFYNHVARLWDRFLRAIFNKAWPFRVNIFPKHKNVQECGHDPGQYIYGQLGHVHKQVNVQEQCMHNVYGYIRTCIQTCTQTTTGL